MRGEGLLQKGGKAKPVWMNLHSCTQQEMLILKGPKINYLNSVWLQLPPRTTPFAFFASGILEKTKCSIVHIPLSRDLSSLWGLVENLLSISANGVAISWDWLGDNFWAVIPPPSYIISRITTNLLFQPSSDTQSIYPCPIKTNLCPVERSCS